MNGEESPSDKTQELQQQVDDLNQLLAIEKSHARIWTILIGIFVFSMFLGMFVQLTIITPKFEILFADMIVDDGGGLPDFTITYLNLSQTIKENAFISIPFILFIGIACSGFIGFQRVILPRHVWIPAIVTVVILFLSMIFFIIPAVALYIPFS
tara:strand:- start:556 stop:1017 length:462 start_codon:yes stop_codon:yes gene_type:complete